jgi:hypothetical protein
MFSILYRNVFNKAFIAFGSYSIICVPSLYVQTVVMGFVRG